MLEVPYGEKKYYYFSLIFLHSWAKSFSNPKGSAHNHQTKEKAAGHAARRCVPRSWDSGSRRLHLTHAHRLSVCIQSLFSRSSLILTTTPSNHKDKCDEFPTVHRTRWDDLFRIIPQVSIGAGTKNPFVWFPPLFFAFCNTIFDILRIPNKSSNAI